MSSRLHSDRRPICTITAGKQRKFARSPPRLPQVLNSSATPEFRRLYSDREIVGPQDVAKVRRAVREVSSSPSLRNRSWSCTINSSSRVNSVCFALFAISYGNSVLFWLPRTASSMPLRSRVERRYNAQYKYRHGMSQVSPLLRRSM